MQQFFKINRCVYVTVMALKIIRLCNSM